MPTSMAARTPPQRQRDHVPNSRSSSSSLPSPSVFLKSTYDHRLKMGSRAAALPQTATARFRSISMLVQYNLMSAQKDSEAEKETVGTDKGNGKTQKAGEKAKKVVKDAVVEQEKSSAGRKGQAGPVKKSRKRKSNDLDDVAVTVARDLAVVGPPKPAQKRAKREEASAIKDAPRDTVKTRKRPQTSAAAEGSINEQEASSEVAKPRKKTSKCSSHFVKDAIAAAPTDNPDGTHPQFHAELPKNEVDPIHDSTKHSATLPKDVDIYVVPSSSPKTMSEENGLPALNFPDLQKHFAYDNLRTISASPSREGRHIPLPRKIDNPMTVPSAGPKAFEIIIEQPGPVVRMPTKEQFEQEAKLPASILKPNKKASPKKVPSKKGPGGITGRSIARYAIHDVIAQESVAKVPSHFPVFNKPAEAATVPKVNEEVSVDTGVQNTPKVRKPRAQKRDTER